MSCALEPLARQYTYRRARHRAVHSRLLVERWSAGEGKGVISSTFAPAPAARDSDIHAAVVALSVVNSDVRARQNRHSASNDV